MLNNSEVILDGVLKEELVFIISMLKGEGSAKGHNSYHYKKCENWCEKS